MKFFRNSIAAAGLLATGFVFAGPGASAAHAASETVRYAMQKVPEDFAYRAKDWGAPYKVNVVSTVSPSAVRSMQALIAGQADIADSGSGPVLSALSHAEGKLVIVAATHSGGQRHELMVKPGAPYKSLADLKNKRVAVPVGSGAYIIFEQYLAKKGWTNAEFKLVNMNPGDMGSALASGQIDAALAWEPTPSILVTKKVVKVIQSFGEVSADPALLVTTRSFAKDHPEALAKVLASMIDMYRIIKTDPAQAGSLAAKVEGESGAQVSPAAFTRSFQNMTFNMQVTKADLAALKAVGDFMVKKGQIAAVPDITKLIDTSALDQAMKLAKARK